MDEAHEVVQAMCERYAAAVNANDSAAYRRLFAADAIRLPPGAEPERGADAIARSEQADYDRGRWSIASEPLDALAIDDRWVYGIAAVEGRVVAHADGSTRSFRATKTWLLQRQPTGEWLIARQMWNLR